jgi:hypothetical protein
VTSARLGGLLMSAVKSRSASSWTIGTWEGGETLAGAETNSRTNPSLTSLPSVSISLASENLSSF